MGADAGLDAAGGACVGAEAGVLAGALLWPSGAVGLVAIGLPTFPGCAPTGGMGGLPTGVGAAGGGVPKGLTG